MTLALSITVVAVVVLALLLLIMFSLARGRAERLLNKNREMDQAAETLATATFERIKKIALANYDHDAFTALAKAAAAEFVQMAEIEGPDYKRWLETLTALRQDLDVWAAVKQYVDSAHAVVIGEFGGEGLSFKAGAEPGDIWMEMAEWPFTIFGPGGAQIDTGTAATRLLLLEHLEGATEGTHVEILVPGAPRLIVTKEEAIRQLKRN